MIFQDQASRQMAILHGDGLQRKFALDEAKPEDREVIQQVIERYDDDGNLWTMENSTEVGLMGSAAYYNKMVVVSWADAMRHAIHLD